MKKLYALTALAMLLVLCLAGTAAAQCAHLYDDEADMVCNECGYDRTPQHIHDWSAWSDNGDGTHIRTCKTDSSHTETQAHQWGEWGAYGSVDHIHFCQVDGCDASEAVGHSGKDGTCRPKCDVCGLHYVDGKGEHKNISAWMAYDGIHHLRFCLDCQSRTTLEYEEHTGGTATCTQQAVCEICGGAYGDLLGHTEVIDQAVAPTCTDAGLTEGKHCGVCLAVLSAQETVEATGHSYTAKKVEPTCTKKGYTKYTCSACGDTYTAGKTNARGHWYDLWTPNGDGTHSADCRRSGCSHVGSTACVPYEAMFANGESEIILKVCPVCGACANAAFEIVPEAVIGAVDKYALPRGEQIVRGMNHPVEGVLYAFTAAYEYSGKVEPFAGTVSVTLPLDAQVYTDFTLVRVDAVCADEGAQPVQMYTDIAFEHEEGKLTFETDAAGLFLLLPVQ